MMQRGWSFLRAALFALDPERSHEATIAGLERLPFIPAAGTDDPRLGVEAYGLSFPNPVGLAAGFDKDARVPHIMARFGFGFVEVGTVTPRPQAGNPKPRVFRVVEDRGVVNRLGFNNGGHAEAHARLQALAHKPALIGVNVGANRDSTDKTADYVAGVTAFADVADYLTINISSPNTPGVRDLQTRDALDDLLARALAARDETAARGMPRRPVLVKIAPDLTLEDLDDITAVALARGVDGLIVSNTTIARPSYLRDPAALTIGGLSGAPLFRRSTWMLAQTYQRVEGKIPLVGVGGIDSGEAAWHKIRAGATLLQLYTGLIYEGPGLVSAIKQRLLERLDAEGLDGLASAVGADAEAVIAEGVGE